MATTVSTTGLLTAVCGDMWSLSPYPRCDHRCVYCCTGVQGPSTALSSAGAAVETLRRHLEEHPGSHYLLGALSDAYPGTEAQEGVTRVLLAELVRRDATITIITKGTTVLRDVDLLVMAGKRCFVQISVCSTDDDVLSRLDLGAPSGSERLQVLDQLHAAGLRVGLNILPWLPDLTDTAALIERVPDDVEVTLSPLAFGEGRDSMHLLGRTFTRTDVVERYLAEYERFGHVPNTSWVRPSPAPEENHPIYRLPVRRPAPVA